MCVSHGMVTGAEEVKEMREDTNTTIRSRRQQSILYERLVSYTDQSQCMIAKLLNILYLYVCEYISMNKSLIGDNARCGAESKTSAPKVPVLTLNLPQLSKHEQGFF